MNDTENIENNVTEDFKGEASSSNLSNVCTPDKKNRTKALLVIMCIAIFLSVAISATSLVLILSRTNDLSKEETVAVKEENSESDVSEENREEDEYEEDNDDEETEEDSEEPEYIYPEDGVVIAEEYTILPTTHISDAYLSGDTSALNEKDLEVLELASEIIDEYITDDMTDFEKEKAIFDWMTENLSYDDGALTVIPTSEEDSDNPYGALKYHNAVCVGYATTFRLFMEMLEIPCRVIPESYLSHSWNLVQIEGEWYHTDVWSGMSTTSYTSFNMNDSMMLSSYEWDYDSYPEASSLTYNILYMNAVECDDVFSIPAIMRKAFENEENMVSLKLDGDDFNTYDIADNIMYRIEYLTYENSDYDNIYLYYSLEYTDDALLLMVSIEYWEDEDYYGELNEEDEQAMIDALDQAFGDSVEKDFWASENMYY